MAEQSDVDQPFFIPTKSTLAIKMLWPKLEKAVGGGKDMKSKRGMWRNDVDNIKNLTQTT